MKANIALAELREVLSILEQANLSKEDWQPVEQDIIHLAQLVRNTAQKQPRAEAQNSAAHPASPAAQAEEQGEVWKVWSDGACSGNPGRGGWGSIVQHADTEQELSGAAEQTTNNRMELFGALQGLQHTPVGARVQLYSDSKYLVEGMTKWIPGWQRRQWRKADGNPVLNLELWQDLNRESSRRKVHWIWVKGHADNAQNNRCDQLARQAILQNK